MKSSLLWSLMLVTTMLLLPSSRGDNRTMSNNNAVLAVPAPGKVVIDGKDDDWDLSAGVWSYNDPTIVERYSVWTHLMYDDQGIYFLARYNDPSPMKNAASSKDFSQSWRADCYQARIIFDDRTDDEHIMHVNMYYSSTDERPYMIVKHGGFRSKAPYDDTGPDRPDQAERWGNTMDDFGGSIAIVPREDGTGYTMEAFWPWSYCRVSGQPLKPGDSFVFGIEAMWGNSDGTTMEHRLADNVKDDTVNRIFMFRARKGWGRAILSDKGNLQVTESQEALQQARAANFVDYSTSGSVAIAYALPENRDVTIAIDNAEGVRVRNLFGQYPREGGDVTDHWDCLDDAGNPVPPGTYTATILHHRPIELAFFNSVYSSSIPPWPTEKGSLLWGSNHGHPTSIATRGELTVAYFTGTEGGSGIIRINDQGIITWSDGNEFLDGAIDDTYAYGLSRSSWQKQTLLFRYRLADGHLTPFEDEARTPSPSLLPHANIATHGSLAFANGKLWACIPEHGLLQVDPKTGAVEATHELGSMVAVTDLNGQLHALMADGAVVNVDAQGKVAERLFTASGLQSPMRLSLSQDGSRIAISDTGSNQVHVYSRAGNLLKTIGSAYSGDQRPAGAFVIEDLVNPMGTGFDHLGRLWITEASKTCKRVTCWSTDYTLIDQYWGQADYGAMSGFPIVNDSTRFIAHGLEFKLDPDPQPTVRKTNEQPLVFHPQLAHERGLIHQINGRDYAAAAPGFNKMDHLSIFLRGGDQVFREVVRIDLSSRNKTATAWIDRNANGEREPDEITEGLNIPGLYWANGWVRDDLTIVTTHGYQFSPTGFTDAGVPLYAFEEPRQITNWIKIQDAQGSNGTPVMDRAGNVSNGIAFHTVDGRRGQYPNPYGRHDAPAAQRGLLIAPFRTNGVVEDLPGIGSMTALGGDRGEWFLMSMDGLFISNICQDIKSDVTPGPTFIGAESFGGFIWRDATNGKVLVQLGGPSYRIMEVLNLETSVRETRTLTLDAEAVAAGARIAQERQQQETAEPARLTIASIRPPAEAPPTHQPLTRPLLAGTPDLVVHERGNASRWFRAAIGHNHRELIVAWQVADPSPWKNAEGRFTHAFIGGDGVDLKLEIPGRGPVRILTAPVGGENTVVYWQQQAETQENPTTYVVANNPANAKSFDVVKRLDAASVQVNLSSNAYTVLLRVPLAEIGLNVREVELVRGLIGVIYSDPSGTNRASRLYWHDKQTGLVSDVPSEAGLETKRWGEIEIGR